MRTISLACALLLAAFVASAEPGSKDVSVFKTPKCGCCSKWAEHLERNGFSVAVQDTDDLERIKLENGVPRELSSCHTAFVSGYVIEGHVPASDIARLLRERPPVAGLAVPGMPIGSPGMEGPGPEAYDVLSFASNGEISVFSSHRP